MGRCVIIGNADINNYEKIKTFFTTDDYFVFCDGGLKHKEKLSVEADFIVGDFDSYKQPDCTDNLLKLPCEKDDTDSIAAVKLMLKNNFKDFLLIGVVGNRFDHTFANISLLLYLKENEANGLIVDDYSTISLLEKENHITKNSCRYFSLLSLSEKLEGVYIKGAKYPLINATIDSSYQYAVSNETVEDVIVAVEKGNGILVKVF